MEWKHGLPAVPGFYWMCIDPTVDNAMMAYIYEDRDRGLLVKFPAIPLNMTMPLNAYPDRWFKGPLIP